ncbi:MAG TPA: DUF4384 domain-containing protein [Blastocatellia bacterium]|nr:DUF4384 domain-containing protein [Blastocatellia bacterium]
MRSATLMLSTTLILLAVMPAPRGLVAANGIQKNSGSSSVWTEEAPVERKAKIGRKAVRPRHKVERVRLLTLEYRILERAEDSEQVEANPLTLFHAGDRVRLSVKANQDGYLYIVNQTEDSNGRAVDPPRLIFPDSRINNGQNFVRMNEEIVLPGGCSQEFVDQQGRCWWWMNQKAGTEVIILILSRDLITDLQDNTSAGMVKADYIARLKASSGERLRRTGRPDLSPEQGGGAGRYITWVTNTNTADNEELIETVRLNHAADNQAFQQH